MISTVIDSIDEKTPVDLPSGLDLRNDFFIAPPLQKNFCASTEITAGATK